MRNLLRRATVRGPIPVEVDNVRYSSFKTYASSPECADTKLATNKVARQRYRNELRDNGWCKITGTIVLALPQ